MKTFHGLSIGTMALTLNDLEPSQIQIKGFSHRHGNDVEMDRSHIEIILLALTAVDKTVLFEISSIFT